MSTVQGVIILEGADGSGKTTLARHLVKAYDATYMHHGYQPKTDWGRRYLASLRRAERLAAAGRLVVIDRCYLSADAYGTVYRGRSDVPRRGRLLHRLALKMSALTVICQPPLTILVKNFDHLKRKRDEMYEDILEVARWFSRLATSRGPVPGPRTCYGDVLTEPRPEHAFWNHAVTYDWSREGQDLRRVGQWLVERLMNLRQRQHRLALNPSCYNIAGHALTARVIAVGDKPGPRAGVTRWPFVSGDERQWCCWFAKQLNQAGILDERLLWTNGCVEDPAQDVLPKLLNDYPWMKVVALGREALHRLNYLGCIPDLQLRHPQFQKRFYHDEPGYLKPLVRLLEEAKEPCLI